MTTTSVKDVGSVLSSGFMPGSAASKSAEASFQAVWDSQAGADRADAGQENGAQHTVKQKDDAAKPGDDLRAKDNSRKDINKEDAVSETQKGKADELSEEDLEKAAEIAGIAAMELLEQIADTFGVSVEEVQGIMADMNLELTDLLQPENLSDLLLQVSGAESSLALLTNEQLYADYQMLMEQGKAALQQCCESMEMSPEEFMQAALQEVADETVPELTMERPAEEDVNVELDSDDNGDEEQTFVVKNGNETGEMQNAETAGAFESRQDGAGQKENGQMSADAGSGNLVLQTIRNENAQPQAVETPVPSTTWSTETQDMMRQIMDYMRVQVKPDVSSLEMQLHPASLGTLQIHVASEGGVLTANFITENETVKAAIESQMVQLKESFAEQGVKVEAIEVTVQTHQFEQNLEQGRGRQPQGETSGNSRVRTRKINLGGLDGMDVPEDLEAEDQLTAEMMAANGQTVDYTA